MPRINPAAAAAAATTCTNSRRCRHRRRRHKRPTRIKLPTATMAGLRVAAVLFIIICGNIGLCDSLLQTQILHTSSSSSSAKFIYNNNNHRYRYRCRDHHRDQQYITSGDPTTSSSPSCLSVSLHDIPFDAIHSAYSSAAAHASTAAHSVAFTTTTTTTQHHFNSNFNTNVIVSSLPDTLELPKTYAESIQAIGSSKELQSVSKELQAATKLGNALRNELDIGAALNTDSQTPYSKGSIPELQTSLVLNSVGQDLLIFLGASVVVTPLANLLGVSPILGYLILGALLGPNGVDLFANSKADVELGDFGILFLLFSEGLEVSKSRLNKLALFLPLAFAQISLCAAALSWGILNWSNLERFAPTLHLDDRLINISQPIEALILALALTLSTSAFVFPVLNERGWEDEESGQAATSILLLQDLAVAPLLVLLPFVVEKGPTDYTAIGFLTAKTVLGFGSIIYVGSILLQKIFNWVAITRSTETFVALCLLVSVGMGTIAKSLGLTDTAGAFAAGVLLANTNYRAQIQADILPFKGILLGIFFMVAGSSFDIQLCLEEFPTIATGVLALIALKAITLFAATRVPKWLEPNRLSIGDSIKLSLLLSGGGEFAFVVLALAERLEVLPPKLGGLLTAIILITMAVTPLLGEFADSASKSYVEYDKERRRKNTTKIDGETTTAINNNQETPTTTTELADDCIVVCGYGAIGQEVVKVLGDEYDAIRRVTSPEECDDDGLYCTIDSKPRIIAFDNNPKFSNPAENILIPTDSSIVLFGDGSNPEVLLSSGVKDPEAIFISYDDSDGLVSSTTARLRASFPDSKIYARAQTRSDAQALVLLGASEVVIESDELPRSAAALVWGKRFLSLGGTGGGGLTSLGAQAQAQARSRSSTTINSDLYRIHIRQAAATASGVSLKLIDDLLETYHCVDVNESGLVDADELVGFIRKSNSGVASDDEIETMEKWIRDIVKTPIDPVGFCRVYVRAPALIKRALNDACLLSI